MNVNDKNILEKSVELINFFLDEFTDKVLKNDEDYTSEDKLWILNLIKENRLLPINNYISGPETVYNFLSDNEYVNKYSTYYYCDYPDGDIADDENKEEVIDEIWEYVKRFKVIGCVIDW